MKNKIFIVSKPQFNDIMSKHDIDDSNVEEKVKDTALISINDTIGDWSEPWFESDHSNVLRMWFDDVSSDLEVSPTNKHVCKAFTEEQAKEIVDFVDRHKDQNFIVHCAAGISRSGAVGTFILDYVDGDKEHFKKTNIYIHPNAHISRILNNIIWKRNAHN